MKMKFNSDYEVPLNKTIKIPGFIMFVRTIFYENSKYYGQGFLDEYFIKC